MCLPADIHRRLGPQKQFTIVNASFSYFTWHKRKSVASQNVVGIRVNLPPEYLGTEEFRYLVREFAPCQPVSHLPGYWSLDGYCLYKP